MNVQRRIFLTSMALAGALLGCAGTPFKWSQARKIQAGMTTEEVKALVGQPTHVKAQGDVLIYVWTWVNLAYSTRTLRVDFRDNKVISAPPIPAEFTD